MATLLQTADIIQFNLIYSRIFSIVSPMAGKKGPLLAHRPPCGIIVNSLPSYDVMADDAELFKSQTVIITALSRGSMEVVRDVGEVPSGRGSTVLTTSASAIRIRVYVLKFLSLS